MLVIELDFTFLKHHATCGRAAKRFVNKLGHRYLGGIKEGDHIILIEQHHPGIDLVPCEAPAPDMR